MKPPGSKIAREAALAQIKTAMIEKKLTQAELADASDCHEKTIQNLMGGRSVRDQTLFDVCMVLGLDFDKLKSVWNGGDAHEPMELTGDGGIVAPVYMGAYTRAAVDHYIGSYLTLRPSFARTDTIVAYRTDVTWDPDWPSLLFQEHDRPDAPYSHRGRIYVPPASMFIHLVSLTKGAMRMVVVSQIDRFSEMRGIITTLHKHGAMLMPVATPIVYAKRDDFSGALGDVGCENPSYAGYKKALDDTTAQGYARLVGA
jgi:DNA-binding Xre family transcriptional regulator